MHNEELAPLSAATNTSSPAGNAPIPKPSSVHLTPRESEIVRFVMLGESNKQIARRLGISNYTVRDHVSNLLKKTGVTSRSRLALVLPTPVIAAAAFPSSPRPVGPIGGTQRSSNHALHDSGLDRNKGAGPWGK
jgi:DNA-binding CsgD family transcriptional regulator